MQWEAEKREREEERGRESERGRQREVKERSDGTSKLNKNNLSKCPSIEQIKLL